MLRSHKICWAIGLGALLLGPAGAAQVPRPPAGTADAPVADIGAHVEAKTLKERLSDKASDEQRVDNCRVPPARRGQKIRPDCASGPSPSRDVPRGPLPR